MDTSLKLSGPVFKRKKNLCNRVNFLEGLDEDVAQSPGDTTQTPGGLTPGPGNTGEGGHGTHLTRGLLRTSAHKPAAEVQGESRWHSGPTEALQSQGRRPCTGPALPEPETGPGLLCSPPLPGHFPAGLCACCPPGAREPPVPAPQGPTGATVTHGCPQGGT